MRANKRSVWIGALALGLLATVAAGSAGAFGRRGHAPVFGHLEQRLERMDLSPDVRAKAFAILDGARANERTVRDQIRTAHKEIGSMIASGAPDEKALDARIDKVGALQTQHHKQFLHTVLQIAAVLPDAQREQWLAPPDREHRGPPGGRRSH